MPTVLIVNGWRLFFYSNEGQEPMHIHACKGEVECKYWLIEKTTEIRKAFFYNRTPKLEKEIKSIIRNNFNFIVNSWYSHFNNL